MAPIARMVRSTMLEILESDYIEVGLGGAAFRPAEVIYGDALEQCADPGHHHPGHRVRLPDGRATRWSRACSPGLSIGNYAITSLMTKDSGPIQSFVLFVAVLYVAVNFVIDMVLRPDRSAHPARLMADAAETPIP